MSCVYFRQVPLLPALMPQVTGHIVAYIKSLWSKRELECQGPKHMQCM
jgi:hypothetical protein